ncbi:restriction endonuclease subunit S [Klebsiella michiganensis]|uniref:restriction endonuclease subunit S n=1 Tax=Klebsiella michiganensis TaxID=1134687 RepID=UPI001C68C06F|nr:restriction endonuclease subunit S [Klebsiella michiganensis]MDS7801025.1 restriction endonuclease subunit S [Klebsiella michiganensis]
MGFEIVQLQSICKKIVSGGTPKSTNPDFYNNGTIPWVKTKEVNNNRIYVSENYITELGLKSSSAKIIPANSVIIAMYGNGDTAGRVAINKIPVSTNQACCNLIIDHSKADYRYVFYFLRTQYQRLVDLKNGGAQQNLNAKTIKEYPFPCAPLQFQNVVADILEGLDEKIILNQCINQTLEQMAQALFKSWFVDFEPVKAKMAVLEAGGSQEDATLAAMMTISGKDVDALAVFEREHPEQYAELKATAELFPSAMQDSEMGAIPEGWALGTLSDIAIFANGKVDVSSLTPATYVSTENMLENRAGISSASSLPSVNSVPNFRRGHVLISNIRPYFKKIWLARFEGGRSADVLAFEARDSVTVEYIYNLLYQESFFDFMMLTSKGVKMPRGDKKAIMGWQCICPEKKISHAFSKAVGNYYSFIESNHAQNKTLTQLRDTLLPKLLSGEITLPEAEQAVSEAENV